MAGRKAGGGEYEQYKARQAQISRDRSADGREVGPLPAVRDPGRRNRGLDSLEDFCRTYFPARFYLPFSSAHREAIRQLEACTDAGGQFCCAMPRGSGKDTLAECAVLRAALYGLRRYVVLIAATERHAERSLKKIKAELESNDLLLEDFPEVCHPVRMLERIVNRCRGQVLDGRPTRMEWTADSVSLPVVPGAASSGAVIQVAGLTGAIRGLSVLGPDGQPVRPDLVLLNDCQTRESARSPTQTAEREAVIADDVLMLAGPTTTIAAVNLCTVIYPNDLSDRFLSDKHPEWQSVRTKLVEAFPARMDLWDRYAELRREDLTGGDRSAARATAFYAANRAEMDRDGVVSWPERKKDGELSGLQSALNVFYENPRGFHAEMQNDPQAADRAAGAKELAADAVAARVNGVARGTIPRECDRLVCFIDCGKSLLWYCLTAWDGRCNGAVIDYGCFPGQPRSVFAAADARPSLSDRFSGLSEPQLLYAGLAELVPAVLDRAYPREGGGELRVSRCLIDAGWLPEAVQKFIRASPHAATLFASKGTGRSATQVGVARWKLRAGERSGPHWKLTAGERGGRLVMWDPDYFKGFAFDRLTTAPGGAGCLTLFGKSAAAHGLIAEHCAAEYAEPVTLRGDTFDKWLAKPDRPDNHLWDCLVGCGLAASVDGMVFHPNPAAAPDSGGPPKPIRLSDLQKAKRLQAAGRR